MIPMIVNIIINQIQLMHLLMDHVIRIQAQVVEPLRRLPRALGRVTKKAEEEKGRVDPSPPAKGLPVGTAEESEVVEVREAPETIPPAGAHYGAHDFCEHVRAAVPAEGEADALVKRGPE